jgi:hypothetical protein
MLADKLKKQEQVNDSIAMVKYNGPEAKYRRELLRPRDTTTLPQSTYKVKRTKALVEEIEIDDRALHLYDLGETY